MEEPSRKGGLGSGEHGVGDTKAYPSERPAGLPEEKPTQFDVPSSTVFRLRMDRRLYEAAKRAAENDRVDITGWIRTLMAQKIRGEVVILPPGRKVGIVIHPAQEVVKI